MIYLFKAKLPKTYTLKYADGSVHNGIHTLTFNLVAMDMDDAWRLLKQHMSVYLQTFNLTRENFRVVEVQSLEDIFL